MSNYEALKKAAADKLGLRVRIGVERYKGKVREVYGNKNEEQRIRRLNHEIEILRKAID